MGYTWRQPRKSRTKRRRQVGFRSRMKTRSGRKMISRRRRIGRTLPSVKRG